MSLRALSESAGSHKHYLLFKHILRTRQPRASDTHSSIKSVSEVVSLYKSNTTFDDAHKCLHRPPFPPSRLTHSPNHNPSSSQSALCADAPAMQHLTRSSDASIWAVCLLPRMHSMALFVKDLFYCQLAGVTGPPLFGRKLTTETGSVRHRPEQNGSCIFMLAWCPLVDMVSTNKLP